MGRGGYSRAVVGRGMSAKRRNSPIFVYVIEPEIGIFVIIILK